MVWEPSRHSRPGNLPVLSNSTSPSFPAWKPLRPSQFRDSPSFPSQRCFRHSRLDLPRHSRLDRESHSVWASELGLLSDFPFWKPFCHSWLDFPSFPVWKFSRHSRRALLSGLTVATRKGQSAVDGLPEASRAFRRALSPPKAGTKRRTPLYNALCGRVVRFVLFGIFIVIPGLTFLSRVSKSSGCRGVICNIQMVQFRKSCFPHLL